MASIALKPEEIAVRKTWIEQGAEWPGALSNEAERPPLNPKAVSAVEWLRLANMSGFIRAMAREPGSREYARAGRVVASGRLRSNAIRIESAGGDLAAQPRDIEPVIPYPGCFGVYSSSSRSYRAPISSFVTSTEWYPPGPRRRAACAREDRVDSHLFPSQSTCCREWRISRKPIRYERLQGGLEYGCHDDVRQIAATTGREMAVSGGGHASADPLGSCDADGGLDAGFAVVCAGRAWANRDRPAIESTRGDLLACNAPKAAGVICRYCRRMEATGKALVVLHT